MTIWYHMSHSRQLEQDQMNLDLWPREKTTKVRWNRYFVKNDHEKTIQDDNTLLNNRDSLKNNCSQPRAIFPESRYFLLSEMLILKIFSLRPSGTKTSRFSNHNGPFWRIKSLTLENLPYDCFTFTKIWTNWDKKKNQLCAGRYSCLKVFKSIWSIKECFSKKSN